MSSNRVQDLKDTVLVNIGTGSQVAFGAALYSLVSSGLAESLEEIQKKIKYA